eukprot:evm.model.NODE_29940_length_27021_cov_30.846083.2
MDTFSYTNSKEEEMMDEELDLSGLDDDLLFGLLDGEGDGDGMPSFMMGAGGADPAGAGGQITPSISPFTAVSAAVAATLTDGYNPSSDSMVEMDMMMSPNACTSSSHLHPHQAQQQQQQQQQWQPKAKASLTAPLPPKNMTNKRPLPTSSNVSMCSFSSGGTIISSSSSSSSSSSRLSSSSSSTTTHPNDDAELLAALAALESRGLHPAELKKQRRLIKNRMASQLHREKQKQQAAGVWQTVKAGTVAGGHKTAEGLDTVKDKVGEALGVARNKASSAAHTVVKKTQEATSPVRERAARGFHTKKEEGKETTQAIKAQLVGKAEDATDAIKAKVGEVVARGSETGAQAQERVHEMGQRVAEHAEAVKSKGQSMAQATKQSGQSGMHQAKKTAQEATGTTAEYVGGAAGKVSGLMEGTAGEVQHQPKGKEGGRIGPVTVGFGEPQLHEREGPSGIKVRGGTKEGGEESVKALARDLATFDMS